MSEAISRAYYLSIDELLIILYKSRIEGLQFPREIVERHADGRQLKIAMERLVKEGYLEDNGNDIFRFSDTLSEWIDILKGSVHTTIIRGDSGNDSAIYIYEDGDRTLSLQIDKHQPEWVRIEILDPDEADIARNNTYGSGVIELYRRNEGSPYLTRRREE